jgi:hypothetical protein
LLEDPLGIGIAIDQSLDRGDAEVHIGGDERALQNVEVFLHRRILSGRGADGPSSWSDLRAVT